MSAPSDPYDLARFLIAQEGCYATALAELHGGRKRSHWMWYIFPQLASLGRSTTARYYGVGSAGEARAFLAHPVLGARLRETVATLERIEVADARAVFGDIDALKLRSSLTLFASLSGEKLFAAALERWCGAPDPATVALLAEED